MAKTAQKKDSNATENTPEPQLFATDPPPAEHIIDPEAPSDEASASEPKPDKPKIGRPKKEDAKDTTNQIIDKIREIEDWSGVKVYLYRDYPITNRRNGGNQYLNIETFQRPFDQGDIMKMHGSGVYGLRVNQTDPTTGRDKTTQFGKLHILNMAYPPKIPRGEWVDDPRNADWKWVKEKWEEQDEEKAKANAPPPASAFFAPVVDLMKDQLTETRQELRALREQQAKGDPQEKSVMSMLLARAFDPPKTDPAILAILDRLTAPAASPIEHKPSPLEVLAMDLLKQRLMPTEPAKVETPLDALDKQIALDKKLKENYGGGETGKSSKLQGWQEFGVAALEAAQPYLAPFANVIARGMEMNMQLQAQQQMQARQQQPPQQQAPQPELREVTPQPAAAPGPQLVPSKPTPEVFAATILDHLQKEFTGSDLGDWYLDNFGEKEFTAVRLQGKDRLLMELNGTAIFQHDIAQYAQSGALDEMLTDFITWERDSEPAKEEKPDVPPIEWGKGVTTKEAQQ